LEIVPMRTIRPEALDQARKTLAPLQLSVAQVFVGTAISFGAR
jgi:hypothetical protein